MRMSPLSPFSAGLLAAAVALGTVNPASAESPQSSLYARMGGKPTVDAIVGETIDQVVANHKLGRSFEGSNIERIKRLLSEQICSLAGGGCVYTGDPMRDVHAGHHISEAEFYGLVEILRTSMRAHHVRLRERNELLALLAPMKRDVVENTPPPPVRGH